MGNSGDWLERAVQILACVFISYPFGESHVVGTFFLLRKTMGRFTPLCCCMQNQDGMGVAFCQKEVTAERLGSVERFGEYSWFREPPSQGFGQGKEETAHHLSVCKCTKPFNQIMKPPITCGVFPNKQYRSQVQLTQISAGMVHHIKHIETCSQT